MEDIEIDPPEESFAINVQKLMAAQEQAKTTDSLQFQDLSYEKRALDIEAGPEPTERAQLLGETEPQKSAAYFWSVTYYQPFFDIDTRDVTARVLKALWPFKKESFFMEQQPDLYGPFWICTTLSLALAMTGNLISWLSFNGQNGQWASEFEKLLVAASLVYGCAVIVPLVLWFILKQSGSSMGLVEIVSLYGYSLLIFIPATILCSIPVAWVDWMLLFGAGAWSILFLTRSIWIEIQTHVTLPKHRYIAAGFVCSTHFALLLLAKLYFFRYLGF
eukprot:GILJ01001804.1.p1 GENE.GILJ01001804.1~~GILJ01001804.1.p1  ORF type:complete len:289 (+),score=31.56 GILJ01001804.1:43-867(+)